MKKNRQSLRSETLVGKANVKCRESTGLMVTVRDNDKNIRVGEMLSKNMSSV